MSFLERTQSQTYYKEPDLKRKLAQTKSCPPTATRGRRSESSIRSNGSFVPKLPPNFRHESVTGVTTSSLKDVELNAIESSTSSSVFHGIILVSIMLSSLIAFVCSKMKRPCDQSDDYSSSHNCLIPVLLFFSVITIISCLISFIIYFLHLIGQCDVQWIRNKKLTIEIVIISVIVIMLITANILMSLKTRVLKNPIGIFSIVCSSLSIIGYAIRITKLFNESKYFVKRKTQNSNHNKIDEMALKVMKEKLKNKLNTDCRRSWELSENARNSNDANHQSCGSALRVVSYVKRKRSLESTTRSTTKSIQQNKNSNSFDMDIDDDVFIN